MSLASTKAWKKLHPNYMRECCWRLRDAVKIEVLSHYGPSGQLCCSSPNCHISDPDMLVLDHIENNGAAQRKELNLSGWNFYQYLKRWNFPEGYQTLCCNHNNKKELVRARDKRKK